MNRHLSPLLAVLLALGLSGCASQDGAYPFARMSPTAPPLPLEEEKLMAEDPTIELWRPGYWNYDGFEFKWIPGLLIPRPDPTAVWGADRWEFRTYGWAFVPGNWQ